MPDMDELDPELKEIFNKDGLIGLRNNLEKSLEKWKEVPLKIGVVGRSGVGKSSFINAIRGLTAEDELGAPVGVTETTLKVKQYIHPANAKLVLCDLPGVGTVKFPKATYFQDIGADDFDIFLIITADRFTENDKWLAREIKKKGKGFLFIRTKIGQDLENDRRAKRTYYLSNPDAVKSTIATIKETSEEGLEEFLSEKKSAKFLFLIDSYDCRNPLFDFDTLATHLIENVPELKKDALLLSMTVNTPSIIEAKAKVLRSRMMKVCIASAIGGALPIPGLNVAIDTGLILREVKFYRSQLGLDEDKLKNLAHSLNENYEAFQNSIQIKTLAIQFTMAGIMKMSYDYAKRTAVKSASTFLVKAIASIIGPVAGGYMSYKTTHSTLSALLDTMVNDAKRINDHVVKKLGTPKSLL